MASLLLLFSAHGFVFLSESPGREEAWSPQDKLVGVSQPPDPASWEGASASPPCSEWDSRPLTLPACPSAVPRSKVPTRVRSEQEAKRRGRPQATQGGFGGGFGGLAPTYHTQHLPQKGAPTSARPLRPFLHQPAPERALGHRRMCEAPVWCHHHHLRRCLGVGTAQRRGPG